MEENDDSLEPYYFQPEEELIFGQPVSPITDAFTDEHFPSFVERFYKRYYYIKQGAHGIEPYKVLFHSNRICLICLAREHPAMSVGISGITFDIRNTDRSKNVVKGKGKKGGMALWPETILAILSTCDGRTYKIPSCLRGKLVEINSAVIEDPKCLASTSEGEGFLAIIQLSLGICDLVKASLLTQEDYDKALAEDAMTMEKVDVAKGDDVDGMQEEK